MILPYILKTVWCMNIILWEYESMWPHVWPQNKCRYCDPNFMVQWFCLIYWRPFDVRTSYFWIMSWCEPTFYLKINVGHCDPHFMVPWFCHILKTIWCMNIILSDYEWVWPYVWAQNKYRSLWPIFHGPVILSYLEDHLIYEHRTFGLWVGVTLRLISK